MGYYIDFSKVSLAAYRKRLMQVNLVPSRMLLRKNIDEQFGLISATGINNIAELAAALKTAKKLKDFTTASGVEEKYLTVLRREINSTVPKPNLFKDFPGLDGKTAAALEQAGIADTLQLYDRVLTAENRVGLAKETGIEAETVLKLAKLSDLSRVQWVNHTFAAMLYELGYETARQLSAATPEKLNDELNRLNREWGVYSHGFGLADMERVIFAAGELDYEIDLPEDK